MPRVDFATLGWSEIAMPGAGAPVRLARLPSLSDGAFRAFVRFPAGWSRTQPGYYEAAEEFLVLEGDLALDEVGWAAGGYAWIPARATRRGLRSEAGALVFAWFSAPPRWIAGAPPALAGEPIVRHAHWSHAPGGLLHCGPTHRTRVGRRRDLATGGGETLGLATLAWCHGEPDPGADELVMLRVAAADSAGSSRSGSSAARR
jgi:hypothetical protein